ncbi:MAG: amidohydrolase, partial [Proteobacteria bacterium]|nr:amidohydrolase [Pseudomonadota bacterium]
MTPQVVAWRRDIHAHPELSNREFRTAALVAKELEALGFAVRREVAHTGVVGVLKGGRPGRVVALRADMDALPVTEQTGLPFASKVRATVEGREVGVMHACGHDGHVAMLLGAAEVLHGMRDRFAGTVRLLFQPGEEGYGGADVMLGEGALDGVDAAFALHLASRSPTNMVATRRGAILAAADTFFVSFKGSGGHASLPYQGRDPIPAVGPFVDGLSHVAARETDPDDPVVFSVTMVRAGSAMNVLPPEAECSGTIRTLSHSRRETAHAQLRRVAEGVAAARGLEVEIRIARGYPPTINHDDGVARMVESARGLNLRVHEM